MALLLVAYAGNPAAGAGHRNVWAVISSSEVQDTGLGDLVQTALSKQTDIKLVERERIDLAVRELALDNLLGPTGAADRLALGSMLQADILIVLALEKRDNRPFVRVVIAECTYGARLLTTYLPYSPTEKEQISIDVLAAISETRNRYREGVKVIVGVLPFLSRNLVHDYDGLQDQFAYVVESGLAARPGVAVLEVQEARAIQQELALKGGEVSTRVVPAFVEGAFLVHVDRGTVSGVTLEVHVTGGRDTEVTDTNDFPSLQAAASYLQTRLPARILRLSDSEAATGLSPDQQASLLARRADLFAGLGDLEKAAGLREALLLVSPNDAAQMKQLVGEYARLVPYKGPVPWQMIDDQAALADWRRRVAHWRRGLELLETMIRRGSITLTQVISLNQEMNQAIDYFVFFVPESPSDERVDDPAVVEALADQLAECTAAHKTFVRDVYSLVPRLDTNAWKSSGNLRRAWLNQALTLPDHTLREEPQSMASMDLRYCQHVLEDVVPDMDMMSQSLTRWIGRVASDPDFERSLKRSDFVASLQALAASSNPMARAYGEVGLKSLMAEAGPAAGAGQAPSPAKAQPEKRPAAKRGQVQIVELPMNVRTAAGDLKPLADSAWSGEAGWFNEIGSPFKLVSCGTFDVLISERAILIHRKPGVLDQVLTARVGDSFQDIAWDGKQVWVSSAHSGICALSPEGNLIAKCESKDGLPPAENAQLLAPLSPGKVFAVGSFGKNDRTWYANLELKGNTIAVDVFHEARQVPSGGPLPGTQSGECNRNIAYAPLHIFDEVSPKAKYGHWILIEFELGNGGAIRVQPELRLVDEGDFELSGDDRLATERAYYFLENGNCLLAYGDTIRYCEARSRSNNWFPKISEIYRHGDPQDANFFGTMLRLGDYIYAPGKNWVRLRVSTLEVEDLGEAELGDPYKGFKYWFGVSSHYGLVAWDQFGKFYRCSLASQGTAAAVAQAETPTEGSEPKLVTKLRPIVDAIHLFKEERGLWPEELSELPPESATPPHDLSCDYRWTLEGPNVLHARRVGAATVPDEISEVTYVFGGKDQGWYQTENGKPQLLAVAYVPPKGPDVSQEEIRSRMLAEFDRRIESARDKSAHYGAKVSYLYNTDQFDAARRTCLEWAEACPREYAPREALRDIEREIRAGLGQFEDSREWTEARHSSFAEWFLYNRPGRNASHTDITGATELPFAKDQAEWYLAEYGALVSAEYTLMYDYNAAMVRLCDAWEKAAKEWHGGADASYFAFRAVGNLHMGNVDSARNDAKRAVEEEKAGRLWAGNAEELLRAAERGETKFKYDVVAETRFGHNWRVTPE